MKISKRRKIELFIIALLSTIILITYLNSKGFHAEFYNKTGEDLDSLIIGETLIGHLKKDSSTEYMHFKDFYFDDDFPYENISALIKNKKATKLNWSECGTGRSIKTTGTYSFDLKKEASLTDTTFLYLTGHNQKIFWEEF